MVEEDSPVALLVKRKVDRERQLNEWMEPAAQDDPSILDFLDGFEDDQTKQEGEVHALTKKGVTSQVIMERHMQEITRQMTGYNLTRQMKIELNMTCELLRDMKQRKEALEQDHQQVSRQLEEETQSFMRQKAEHETALSEKTTAAEAAEARAEELESAKDELSDQLDCQAMTAEMMEEQLGEHEERIAKLQTRLSATTVQLESHGKNEQELAVQSQQQLDALIEAHNEEKETATAQMSEMQTELTEVNQQQVEMSTRAAKMMKDKFKAEKKVVELVRERDAALGQVETLQTAAGEQQSEESAAGGQTAEWWQGKAESLTSAVARQQGLIKKLYVRLKEENHRAKLDLETRKAEDELRSIRLAGMSEELGGLRKRVAEYETQMGEKDQEIAGMKREKINARLERALSYPIALGALAAATTPGGTRVRTSAAAEAAVAGSDEVGDLICSSDESFASATSAEDVEPLASAGAAAAANPMDVASAFDLVLKGTSSSASAASSASSEAPSLCSSRPPPSPGSNRPALSPLTMASPRLNGNPSPAGRPMTRSRKAAQAAPMRLGKPEYTPRGGIAVFSDADMV